MLGPAPSTPFDPDTLRLGAERRLGIDPARMDHRGANGWVQVRHGVWIASTEWHSLTPQARHAALVHATALRCDPESSQVFSHTSAAAVWGMPLTEAWPTTVHVITPGRRTRSSGLVVRHDVSHGEAVIRRGLRVTSPARTVIDLGRTLSLASAVAAADYVLRHGLCKRQEIAAEAAALPRGAHGRAQATLVSNLADGRAMSPGESLSRVQMFVMNIPRPDLQVEYRDDEGIIGYGDFAWPGVVGEFDGKIKYGVPEGASPSQTTEVLWREKKREDRLRARGERVVRWTWADALHPQRLATRLAAAGVRREPRNTWIFPAAESV